MNKKIDYLKHANECRKLAQTSASHADRDTLLRMAETWANSYEHHQAQLALLLVFPVLLHFHHVAELLNPINR